ncbi:hypothetical protein [Atlantibacter hermannii]|nr:hypothetical protein [Atlantibacter hermannii]
MKRALRTVLVALFIAVSHLSVGDGLHVNVSGNQLQVVVNASK